MLRWSWGVSNKNLRPRKLLGKDMSQLSPWTYRTTKNHMKWLSHCIVPKKFLRPDFFWRRWFFFPWPLNFFCCVRWPSVQKKGRAFFRWPKKKHQQSLCVEKKGCKKNRARKSEGFLSVASPPLTFGPPEVPHCGEEKSHDEGGGPLNITSWRAETSQSVPWSLMMMQ